MGARSSVIATELKELIMSWTTPEVKEICVGMEINDYMPAEF
ncbi:pyrroloquinoline quinone precursor peptide PqqA [Salinicola halophilus]|nr:pyrroloquinoline quinone precursor peptide PqqA [Salinicola halophilus]